MSPVGLEKSYTPNVFQSNNNIFFSGYSGEVIILKQGMLLIMVLLGNTVKTYLPIPLNQQSLSPDLEVACGEALN